jgi:hypothetical protein
MKCPCCRKKPVAPHRKLCWSCIKKQFAESDPVRYCYVVLKNNAKRRGKKFTISLSFFRKFCTATDYIQNKGKTSQSYSIDRIDNAKGYTKDNIRILSLSENSRKHTKKLSYDWQHKTAIVIPAEDTDNDQTYF